MLDAVASGASHRIAAERFGISAASVIRWPSPSRRQSDPRPGPLGADRRSGRVAAHAETT
ncbi:MAG: IS630 family transposase, partial [Pseudomonadota bacterium]